MSYKVGIQQLQDIEIDFETEAERGTAYNAVVTAITKLGVPVGSFEISKIDAEYSTFLGREVKKTILKTVIAERIKSEPLE